MEYSNFAMHHIVHTYLPEKRFHLIQIVRKFLASPGTQTIILTGSNYTSDEISICLNLNGFRASSIHNEKPKRQNDRSIEKFNGQKCDILVTSNFDVTKVTPQVEHLINYDMFTPNVMNQNPRKFIMYFKTALTNNKNSSHQ